MQFQVSFDEAKFEDVRKLLSGIPGAADKVAISAINRGADHARTLIGKGIRKELNLKQAAVLERIKISRAFHGRVSATVIVSRKPVPLIEYNPKQTDAGVMAGCRKTEPPRLIKEAFIATMKSGHTGVFTRLPGKVAPGEGRYASRKIKRGPRRGQPVLRAPIRQLYGPTVVGVLANKPGLLESINKEVGQTISQRMDSGLQRFLKTGSESND